MEVAKQRRIRGTKRWLRVCCRSILLCLSVRCTAVVGTTPMVGLISNANAMPHNAAGVVSLAARSITHSLTHSFAQSLTPLLLTRWLLESTRPALTTLTSSLSSLFYIRVVMCCIVLCCVALHVAGWRRTYVLAFRHRDTIALERKAGFTHSHNDSVNVRATQQQDIPRTLPIWDRGVHAIDVSLTSPVALFVCSCLSLFFSRPSRSVLLSAPPRVHSCCCRAPALPALLAFTVGCVPHVSSITQHDPTRHKTTRGAQQQQKQEHGSER